MKSVWFEKSRSFSSFLSSNHVLSGLLCLHNQPLKCTEIHLLQVVYHRISNHVIYSSYKSESSLFFLKMQDRHKDTVEARLYFLRSLYKHQIYPFISTGVQKSAENFDKSLIFTNHLL